MSRVNLTPGRKKNLFSRLEREEPCYARGGDAAHSSVDPRACALATVEARDPWDSTTDVSHTTHGVERGFEENIRLSGRIPRAHATIPIGKLRESE